MQAVYALKGASALNSAGSALSSAANSAGNFVERSYQSASEAYDEYTQPSSSNQHRSEGSRSMRSGRAPPESSSLNSLRSARPPPSTAYSRMQQAPEYAPRSASPAHAPRTASPEPTAAAGWSSSIRKAVWGDGSTDQAGTMQRSTSQTSIEGGRFGNLMNAAYAATASVSARVASKVTGNEEPSDEIGPDGDTHLTRTIKLYWIGKATSSDDLPRWLFPDRVSAAKPWAAAQPPSSQPHRAYSDPASFTSSSGSSLRDIFDDPQHRPSSSVSSVASSNRSYGGPTTGGAADRLRAMRDQKRLAPSSGSSTSGREFEPPTSSSLRQPRSVGGLPSGPRPMRQPMY